MKKSTFAAICLMVAIAVSGCSGENARGWPRFVFRPHRPSRMSA